MRVRNVAIAALAVCAIAVGSMESRADKVFSVDPGASWYGYINAFELDGITFATGFPEGNLTTMSANFAAGPANPLTLGPNTRLYDDVILDPYWVDQGTFVGNKIIEANMYQEDGGGVIGETVTFNWSTISNDLPAGYSAVAFIKVLDGLASWATTQYEFAPLVGGSGGSLSFIVADAGAGSEFVQAGFAIKGLAVSSGDPIALTGAVVTIPEPSTFVLALTGLMGLVSFVRKRRI